MFGFDNGYEFLNVGTSASRVGFMGGPRTFRDLLRRVEQDTAEGLRDDELDEDE